MTNIRPNKDGKLKIAKKRLRRNLLALNNVKNLTASQRNRLFAIALIDLTRIKLAELNQDYDDE